MSTYIFGAGGHARVIASVLAADVTFVVGRDADRFPGCITERDIFERPDDFSRDDFYIGINIDSTRRKLFDHCTQLGLRLPVCRASHSFIAQDAQVGAGAVILPGSVVNARAVVGRNTIISTLSSIDHDCVLGDHSQMMAGVTLGGMVRTGEMCFFGIKSAVCPGVTLGNAVTVMAGALVVRSAPDGVTLGGNPAQVTEPRP